MTTRHLIITIGVPGSGKSTLVARSQLPVVSSDDVRAELLGDPTRQDRPGDVWAEIHRRLADQLTRGSVVLEGPDQLPPAYVRAGGGPVVPDGALL